MATTIVSKHVHVPHTKHVVATLLHIWLEAQYIRFPFNLITEFDIIDIDNVDCLIDEITC
jgi:hypothetical protein